jgi:hypothetical protein
MLTIATIVGSIALRIPPSFADKTNKSFSSQVAQSFSMKNDLDASSNKGNTNTEKEKTYEEQIMGKECEILDLTDSSLFNYKKKTLLKEYRKSYNVKQEVLRYQK